MITVSAIFFIKLLTIIIKKNNNNINNLNSNNSIIRNVNSFEDTYFNNTFKKQREIKFPNEVTNREKGNDETTNQLKNRYRD